MPKSSSSNKKFAVLTKLQQKFLTYFAGLPIKKHLYWTGGTALSEIYLQHRFSQDIDLFTAEDISYDDLITVIKGFIKIEPDVKNYTTQKIHDRKLFTLTNKTEFKIEFAKYEFPSIKKRKIWSELTIAIDSLEDIATNKVMSIMDRREPKDVLDLYYILKLKHYSLKQLLQWVRIKFGPIFDLKTLVVEMMGGVKLLDSIQPLLVIEKNRQEKEIHKVKKFYFNLADRYLRRVLY